MVEKVSAIKTTNTRDLVKKADYVTIIGEIEKKILDRDHDEYITIQEFNKLRADKFALRLKQDFDLMKKTDLDDKLINLNKKDTLNKTKHVHV